MLARSFLIITASSFDSRCVSPPPMWTAHLSSRPQTVFRKQFAWVRWPTSAWSRRRFRRVDQEHSMRFAQSQGHHHGHRKRRRFHRPMRPAYHRLRTTKRNRRRPNLEQIIHDGAPHHQPVLAGKTVASMEGPLPESGMSMPSSPTIAPTHRSILAINFDSAHPPWSTIHAHGRGAGAEHRA